MLLVHLSGYVQAPPETLGHKYLLRAQPQRKVPGKGIRHKLLESIAVSGLRSAGFRCIVEQRATAGGLWCFGDEGR